MSFFLGRGSKDKNIPPNATFRITQEGTDKLQSFSGDHKSKLLMALETGGTSDVQELCQASGLSKGQVERLIPALIAGGYVRYVSTADRRGDE